MRGALCARTFLALLLVGCASAPDRAPEHNVLYRISSPSQAEPVAWLLSSPTLKDLAAPEVDAEVARAFAASSSLAVEVDASATPGQELAPTDPGADLDLRELLGRGDFARLQDWLAVMGNTPPDLNRLRPSAAVFALLEGMGQGGEATEATNGTLYFVAVSTRTHALLSADEAQAATNAVDLAIEVSLLRGSLRMLEERFAPAAGLEERRTDSKLTAFEKELEDYNILVSANRHALSAARLDALIQAGERPFVVIDAPEFDGERSLPGQLNRLGYSVEQVSLSGEQAALAPAPAWALLPDLKVTGYTADWPAAPDWQTITQDGVSQSVRLARLTPSSSYFVVAEQSAPASSLPAPSAGQSPLDALFDMALDDDEPDLSLVDSSAIELGGLPGRRYHYSGTWGEYYGVWLWADSVLYDVSAGTRQPDSPENLARLQSFLDSFRLQTYSSKDAERSRADALRRLEDEPAWLFPHEACPLDKTQKATILVTSDENSCAPDVDGCLDACKGGDALACLRAGDTLKDTGARAEVTSALFVRACELGLAEGCASQASVLLLEADAERQTCGADLAKMACAAGEPWGCLLQGVAMARAQSEVAAIRAPLAKVCRLSSQRAVCKLAGEMLLALEATRASAEAEKPVESSMPSVLAACEVSCAPNIPCVAGVCGDVVQLAAGMTTTCALLATGGVLCWGNLGDGENTHECPVPVAGLTDAVELASGGRQVCARRANGTVVCWGDQHFGEFGGSMLTPQTPLPIEGIDDAVQLAVGNSHACVLHRDTRVSCWGGNSWGQVGIGSFEEHIRSPQRLKGLWDVVELSGRDFHTCARVSTGEVVCWGMNSSGELGDGTFTHRREPVQVLGLDDAVQIATGRHSCALRASGAAVCWGNSRRQDWTKEETIENVLVPVDFGGEVTALNVGYRDTCASLADGTAACRGSDWSGEAPAPIVGLDHVVEIVSAFMRTCARLADGRVLCWGEEVEDEKLSRIPVKVVGLDSPTGLFSSLNWTCARPSTGDTMCWGAFRGELGDELGDESNPSPRVVHKLDGFVEIASGYWHVCARDTANTVVCWGSEEESGIVGLEATNPTPIRGLGEVVELSCGGRVSCARLSSGQVKCWGRNEFGELGDGTTEPRTEPVVVAGLDDALRVSAGNDYACALRSNGTAVCWGSNEFGQLGLGSEVRAAAPTPVVGLDDAVDVVAGYGHACALRTGGKVSCWGEGETGQLGNGKWGGQLAPMEVLVTDAVELVVASEFTCARLHGGEVVCWGLNFDGQLGDGVPALRQKPVRVSGIHDAVELSGGFWHTCARLASGEVRCWGANVSGQLGNGDEGETRGLVEVPGLASRRCGDGVLLAEERCDDGNEVAGDGCSATCEVEAGWKCSGTPSWCRAPFIGEDCADPIRMELPGRYEGSFVDRVDDLDPIWRSCTASHATGAELVFAVTVPAGRLVDVKASSAQADLVLYATPRCKQLERTCVAGSDQTVTGGERIALGNLHGMEPLELFVVVDSYVQSEGTFEVEFGAPRAPKGPVVAGE